MQYPFSKLPSFNLFCILYYRTMTTIHDKLLRGPPAPESNPASTGWFVHRLMAIAQEELDASGDRWKRLKDILIERFLETLFFVLVFRDWMVDVVSGASVRLADISSTSRRVAGSFSRHLCLLLSGFDLT